MVGGRRRALVRPAFRLGSLRRFASIDEFAKFDGPKACTLVVAGVGSSALGSAALARNVADAIQAPVVAVVSGYGLADVAAEALGGFVWFGALNSVRHSFEWLDRLRESGVIADPSLSAACPLTCQRSRVRTRARSRRSCLIRTCRSIFSSVTRRATWCFLKRLSLDQVDRPRLREIGEKTCIITLSAKIAMPSACRHVIDVMGQLDAFGAFNSHLDIRTDVTVPAAGHHTNTDLPWHFPVTSVLADLQRGAAQDSLTAHAHD